MKSTNSINTPPINTTATNITNTKATQLNPGNISSHYHHQCVISQSNREVQKGLADDRGNQSDSSSNSNSSLASSPRYNERHPRTLAGKRSRGSCGIGSGCGKTCTTTRGSFVMLGSRTSLPPLNENCPLDATESQLALNLRRATRSTSLTNQMILDTIDGLNTSVQDLDPCLVLGVAPGSAGAKKESPRRSFEKFTLPKSITNLIMQSRSSGSVNPPTSAQQRGNSCYNFLSGITEDEDEEQDDSGIKYSTFSASASGCTTTSGIRLTITPVSIPPDEKIKSIVAGGEAAEDDLLNSLVNEDSKVLLGRRCRNGNVNRMEQGLAVKEVMIQQEDEDCSEQVISSCFEMDSSLCASIGFDKEENNEHSCSLYEIKGKKQRPSAHPHLHSVRFEDDEDDDISSK